jgi:hypothetical protein
MRPAVSSFRACSFPSLAGVELVQELAEDAVEGVALGGVEVGEQPALVGDVLGHGERIAYGKQPPESLHAVQELYDTYFQARARGSGHEALEHDRLARALALANRHDSPTAGPTLGIFGPARKTVGRAGIMCG